MDLKKHEYFLSNEMVEGDTEDDEDEETGKFIIKGNTRESRLEDIFIGEGIMDKNLENDEDDGEFVDIVDSLKVIGRNIKINVKDGHIG